MADSQDKQEPEQLTEAKPEEAKQGQKKTEPKQEAQPEQEQKAQAKPKQKTRTPRKSGLSVFNLLLVLLLAGAVAAGGYYLWQEQQRLLQHQQSDNSRLQQQLSQLQNRSSGLDQSIRSNTAAIQALKQAQQQTEEISQRAIQITNRSQRDWILAEVDYLLRLASRRLEIARDINGAIAALQAADGRIHDLGDLNLLPIRKQLAKDIGQLKALHQADVNGTALALEQMLNHVAELPFKSVQEEVKTQIEETTDKTEEEKPKGFVDSVISTVKNIGDIKVHQRSIQPASSAEQQQQIEQILRSHLLSARLAVLRYDQSQFSHDIQQAQQILHSHYQSDDNRVKQMQDDLLRFSNINLTPDLPGIATAWNMLQDVIRKSGTEVKPQSVPKKSAPGGTDKNSAEVL